MRSIQRVLSLSVLATGLAACGVVEDADRRICDGSGDVRLGLQGMGGFVGPFEGLEVENGSWFLFVDGACHYWVKPHGGAEVRSGVLDAAAEASLADRIAYRKWASIDGDWSSPTPPSDAGSREFWDGVHHASCRGLCEANGTPEPLQQLDAALGDGLLTGLWDRALPYEGPALRLVLMEASDVTGSSLFDWPLESDPSPYLRDGDLSLPYGVSGRVEGDDAATLRALRRDAVAQGKTYEGAVAIRIDEARVAWMQLREALPFEAGNGLVRPPE